MGKIEKVLKGNKGSKYHAVRLEWEDISTLMGWNDKHETAAAKPCICISLGFLVEIQKTQVILCSGFSDDGDIMDVTSYPKGTILRIIYLTKTNKGYKK